MNTETTGAEAPAAEVVAPVAETEAKVETSEATTEQQPEAETQEETGDDAAVKPRKKPGIHNRIDELTRQKHEALREAEYWRTRAQEAAKTDLETLDYDDQLIAKVKITERQERAEAAQRNADQAVEMQFTELENEARQKWADYDTVTRNPHLRITNEMANIIKESELGPDLAYHFGKNPADAARIASLSGTALAREIGRLEAQMVAPKPTPKVPAAPIRPVTGLAAGGAKDPAVMSMAEYVAWRNAGNG